ncbi:TRAP transporter substrate-binding protein DctP [Salinicola sp. MIT1003]|uniref:TRAP transporter substrate-binding protein DctP n=1 Tax=Salinicola sp. MIT1003 TaxID=1882734 RepID=UPI0008DDBC1D|nr:TRAP transporter substrate-binding protein DctP [Salinicola sp. MIT1003]OHZ02710.1 hypothetical protein BC443_13380 [Salinicola sp. MIT1003]
MKHPVFQKSCAALFGVALLLGGISSASADTYRWLTFKPEGANDAQSRSTKWLIQQFNERTPDDTSIKPYWGSSVASTEEVPDYVGGGVGDLGDIITPYFPDRFYLNNAVGFFIPQPLSVTEIAESMEKWHEKYPAFGEEMEKNNLKVIGYRPLEKYGLFCTHPIRTMSDFEGLRIRSYGFAYPRLIEAMGATPISISTAETYEALEKNIIDCTPVGPALARGWKYDEVAKYYIEIPFGASFGHLLVINLDTYRAMDDATRAVVDELGHEYVYQYAGMLQDDIRDVRKEWKESGVEIIKIPDFDMEQLVQSPQVRGIRQEWIEHADELGVPAESIAEQLRP